MSIQAKINQSLGAIGGAVLGIKKSLIERQQDALKKAKEVKVAKTQQRRNFMTALRSQPTGLGINIGALGPKAQQNIAKTYTPYQRKKLMDEYYGGKK